MKSRSPQTLSCRPILIKTVILLGNFSSTLTTLPFLIVFYSWGERFYIYGLYRPLLSLIQLPFEQRTCFIKYEGRLGQFGGLFHPETCWLLNQEFFHQFSF